MRSLYGVLFALLFANSAFGEDLNASGYSQYVSDLDHEDHEQFADDAGLGEGRQISPLNCQAATVSQKSAVNEGNTKAMAFLRGCRESTASSRWCDQLLRPNPSSYDTFACTYGSAQPHRLIHPDESTWPHAYQAVQIIRDLEALGVRVAEIYNWWRPEPYNANVGGAKGRHPFGTSVDVRFTSLDDMKKAHALLCQFRRQGRLRALGYYGSTGLHFGVGDANPNTWGKSCL